MSDYIVFWLRHNRQPELTPREQVALCAAVRFHGFCLQVRNKMRLSRGGK
jgi:hypothetical protein